MDSAKKPWQSKTILINGVLGLISFIAIFAPGADAARQFISDNGAILGTIWSFLNIVLRLVTKDKIALVD